MVIKSLLFDLGGVICDIDIDRGIQNFETLGIKDVATMLNRYKQHGIFHDFECGQINTLQFCSYLRELSGKPYLSDNQIMNAWNSIIIEFPLNRLKKLKVLSQHYNLFLLSNTNPCHFQYFSSQMGFYTLEDLFKTLFLSYEMGVCKPEKKIFEMVISSTSLNPAETLFLDDSEANINTANAMGFQTYFVKNGNDWTTLNL